MKTSKTDNGEAAHSFALSVVPMASGHEEGIRNERRDAFLLHETEPSQARTDIGKQETSRMIRG